MIKKLIENAGIQQVEIATQLGLAPETLSRMINIPEKLLSAKFETVVKLCNILNCTPVDISPMTFEAGMAYESTQAMFDYAKQEIAELFTSDEKKYFADMLNSSLYSPRIHPCQFLRMQVLDSNEYEGLGRKWNVDASALSRKVNDLTSFQAYCVYKFVRDWWNQDNRDLESIF